ncbi:MAG: GGDEF domain-containing protein, partial [Aeromonas sobria]
MQEWDPEHFSTFAQLCEVSLAAIREKTDAERLYLWLKAPEPQLYSFQLDQGLTMLDLAHLEQLTLPHHLIDKAIDTGQLVIEQLPPPLDPGENVEPAQPQLRACFPLKRHMKLEGVIYLETHRRIDRLSSRQRQGIQLLIHYLTAELSNHLLSSQVDQERVQRQHTQTDLVQSQALQGSFLTMLQALHMVCISLSRCRSENQLLRDAVLLARQELQFDRVAIFLIAPDGKTMHGTWGTSEEGELVDEHAFISPIP